MNILKFYSPSCPDCKIISTYLDELSQELNITVSSINVEKSPGTGLAHLYQVKTTPTLIVIKEDLINHYIIGVSSKQQLKNTIVIIMEEDTAKDMVDWRNEMKRCSPVEMRKNLTVVNQFEKYGIDFVAVPVRNQVHKNELNQQVNDVLEEMGKGA